LSRGTWADIIQSSYFYINTYRRGIFVLIVSVILNVLLLMALYYRYFHQNAPDFYATDGVTPPVPLTAMEQPNNSSSALLADEQSDYDNNKVVPQ
jgi:intracellular multiplication protein IcmM